MTSTPHLPEHRLFDCYLTQQAGQPLDPPDAEHLADCVECAAAFNGFASLMQEIRMEGESEADRIFTVERLRAQQASIEKRLRQVGRSARVISFPSRAADAPHAAIAGRTAPRWVAAAAAAGLFVGVALGASYQRELRAHAPSTVRMARATAAPSTRVAPVGTRGIGQPGTDADEEAFLSDLDAALARPRTRELQPLDALTPHVRDVRSELRAPVR
jgi:hypothetical protein